MPNNTGRKKVRQTGGSDPPQTYSQENNNQIVEINNYDIKYYNSFIEESIEALRNKNIKQIKYNDIPQSIYPEISLHEHLYIIKEELSSIKNDLINRFIVLLDWGEIVSPEVDPYIQIKYNIDYYEMFFNHMTYYENELWTFY